MCIQQWGPPVCSSAWQRDSDLLHHHIWVYHKPEGPQREGALCGVEHQWQQTDFLWHGRCSVWLGCCHRKEDWRECSKDLQLHWCHCHARRQDIICRWLWQDLEGNRWLTGICPNLWTVKIYFWVIFAIFIWELNYTPALSFSHLYFLFLFISNIYPIL